MGRGGKEVSGGGGGEVGGEGGTLPVLYESLPDPANVAAGDDVECAEVAHRTRVRGGWGGEGGRVSVGGGGVEGRGGGVGVVLARVVYRRSWPLRRPGGG